MNIVGGIALFGFGFCVLVFVIAGMLNKGEAGKWAFETGALFLIAAAIAFK